MNELTHEEREEVNRANEIVTRISTLAKLIKESGGQVMILGVADRGAEFSEDSTIRDLYQESPVCQQHAPVWHMEDMRTLKQELQ